MRAISRRELLRLAVTGAAAAGVVHAVGLPEAGALDVRAAVARAAPKGSVAHIGRRYVALTPTESSRAVLTPLLPPGAVDGSGKVAWSVVAARTSDDFASGDVVDIDGWHLARSEARAAAYTVVDR
jgi:hypothetical protein